MFKAIKNWFNPPQVSPQAYPQVPPQALPPVHTPFTAQTLNAYTPIPTFHNGQSITASELNYALSQMIRIEDLHCETGPALITKDEAHYYVNGKNVTSKVQEWLSNNDYMPSDHTKWQKEHRAFFKLSLGGLNDNI